MTESAYSLAREIALKRLNRRECTCHEISELLVKKGARIQTATEVVESLKKTGILDDTRYTRLFVRQQVGRDKGARAIRQKLRIKGIDATVELIEELSQSLTNISELDRASQWILRRYPQLTSDPKQAQRALAGLVRRGFSFGVSMEALKNAGYRR